MVHELSITHALRVQVNYTKHEIIRIVTDFSFLRWEERLHGVDNSAVQMTQKTIALRERHVSDPACLWTP